MASCALVILSPFIVLLGLAVLVALAALVVYVSKGREQVTKIYSQAKEKSKDITSMLTFWGAVYTIGMLIVAYSNLADGSLDLEDSPPTSRCVPFFSSVQSFMEEHPSIAVYSYQDGTPTVRLCTNASEATVDEWFPETRYNPLEHCGCSLKAIEENCVPDEDEDMNCEQLLAIAPTPRGVLFHHGVRTDCSSNCSFRFRYYDGLPECTYSSVYALRKENKPVRYATFAFLLFPLGLLCFQVSALDYFHKMSKKGEPIPQNEKPRISWALQSVYGTMYKVCCAKPEFTAKYEIGGMGVYFWAVLVQEIVEAIVIPVIAIHGCDVCQFPGEVIFIVLKGLNLLRITYVQLSTYGLNSLFPKATPQVSPPHEDAQTSKL